MAGVFISYQKLDTRHVAGRLNGFLTNRFGAQQVFRDAARLRPGDRWWAKIKESIVESDVLLVLIGDNWLELLERSNAQLPETGGWVQQEILLAIEQGIDIIPVLIDTAGMPPPTALPPEIAAISSLQGHVVADRTFDNDVEALAKELEDAHGIRDVRSKYQRWWERGRNGVTFAATLMTLLVGALTIPALLRSENRSPRTSCSVQLQAVAGIPRPLDITGCASDPDGDDLSFVAGARSTNNATIDADADDGQVTYTAPITFFGGDSFEYDAVDEDGATVTDVVFVNVLAGAMDKELNVAVVELTPAGDGEAVSLGRASTTTLLKLVTDNLGAEDQLTVDIAGPDRTGTIDGVTFDEQRDAVEDIAARLDAHFVLYGALSADGSTTIETRMYLSPQTLAGATELAGSYPLRDVNVSSSAPAAVRLELERVIEPTVQAIADLARGLAFYQVNQWADAEMALSAAAESWPATPGVSNGKEVLWNLLGNIEGEQGHFDEAIANYEEAIRVGANDARALFGLAEVRFLSSGGPKCGSTAAPDIDVLEDVIDEFTAVQQLPEPEGSALVARSRVEIGRVLLCLSLNGEDRLTDARAELRGVIDDFGSDRSLNDLVGEARQALAFSHATAKEYDEAIAEYLEAIAVSNEEARRAFFHIAIGGIYECDLRDPAKAQEHYELSDSEVAEPLERRDCSAAAPGD